MAPSDFKIVKGYIIPDLKSMLKLLVKNETFTKLIQYAETPEVSEYLKKMDTNEDPLDEVYHFIQEWMADIETDVKINGMNVFTWNSEQSDLEYRKFMLGKIVVSTDVYNLTKHMIDISITPEIDSYPELEKFKIVTVLMPNTAPL